MKHQNLLIFRAILRYPLLALSYLSPRNENKWIFGCRTGFMDNPKHLFLRALDHGNKQCVWMARSKAEKEEVARLGLPVCLRHSLKGFYHCLTAKYFFFSHFANDINFWLSGGSRRVMLWHGVGIKKIGIRAYRKESTLERFVLPDQFSAPKYFLTTSPLMSRHFHYYLDIPYDRMINAMYPRNDLFFRSREAQTLFIWKYEPELTQRLSELSRQSKLFLYMPTYRDTGTDFMASTGIDFHELNQEMEKQNSYFLFKLHPFTRIDLNQISHYPRLILLDKHLDMYPLLPFVDTLITDYSSIYYDFILLKGKKIVLFPFDYHSYMSQCRDFAFDFNEYTPGKRVYTFPELLETLRTHKGSDTDSPEITQIKNRFWTSEIPFYQALCERT